jgi:cysteinyl-tRNA synthetase
MSFEFRLFDTMSREVRPLTRLDGQTYRFYCCGPTVYGPAHIGNFRTFLLQDVFRRVVESGLGWPVNHVRNLTNVDDKTIRQSQAEGKTLKDFTDHWTARFHEDCEALNVLPPTAETGAVEYIPQQISLIEKLIARGHAYAAPDGSVYFDVSTFPGYGKLSRLAEREITTSDAAAIDAANDGPVLADEYVRDSAADFALWKAHRPEDGENYWESPWGKGRPGWHTECSAMSLDVLGDSFDLHSGGIDLIFPHHENEIAQSEACTGHTFANHWQHVEHLMVDGAKMSKSLGNLYTLKDIREQGYTPAAARYVLIAGHYRNQLNYTLQGLHDATKSLERLAKLHARLREAAGLPAAEGIVTPAPAPGDADWASFAPVRDALLDDMNTANALGKLFIAVRDLERTTDLPAEKATAELAGLEAALGILGLRLGEKPAGADDAPPEEVVKLAADRWTARAAKDWATSDALRNQVADLGWTIKDGKDGYDLVKG